MQSDILFEVRNHIGYITLNRPAALNALSIGMTGAMHHQLKVWETDPNVYAVLVRGAGGKAFCAGGDLRALYDSFKTSTRMGPMADPMDPAQHGVFFLEEYRLDHTIHRYPKPYIALMDGIVMGGGMGIAQGATLRIVTGRTRMAMPETGIGLFPDVGGSYFLACLPGAVGEYLGLTGSHLQAADALYTGLADLYLAQAEVDRLDSTLDKLHWSDLPADDILNILRAMGVTALPAPPLQTVRSAIDQHFSKASTIEIIRSLQGEVRPGLRDWAAQTLHTLAKRSPSMLCVTLEQLKRGKSMDLAACLRMELDIVHRCFQQGDFLEGIRALIIDKDHTPRWNPAKMEDVTGEMVARFFRSPWSARNHPLKNLDKE